MRLFRVASRANSFGRKKITGVATRLSLDALLVAGGGGAGSNHAGGGGGAGGLLYNSFELITDNSLIVTVGGGGTGGGGPNGSGLNGTNTSITSTVTSSYVAVGGGAGGGEVAPALATSGGSGGGGSGTSSSWGGNKVGQPGTAGQGSAGGNGSSTQGDGYGAAGGGGGAVGTGANASGNAGGAGGAGSGAYSTILTAASAGVDSGGTRYIAGGGGGGGWTNGPGGGGAAASGGLGGGGNSAASGSGSSGSPNTGGGGGGSGGDTAPRNGGTGGGGIVIIRYPGSQAAMGGTINTTGGFTYHKYTATSYFYATEEVKDSLALFYDASINASYSGSGTTMYDLSGNSRNGAMDNCGYSSSNGGYITFNGSSSRIRVGAVTSGQNITYSLWFYRQGSSAAVLFWDDDSQGAGDSWVAVTASNLIEIQSDNSGFYFLSSVGAITSNRWNNLTFVASSSSPNKSIYINGALDTSNNVAIRSRSGISYVTLGHGYDGGGNIVNQWFQGYMSKFSIYSRALTAAEVAQNYNANKSRFGLS